VVHLAVENAEKVVAIGNCEMARVSVEGGGYVSGFGLKAQEAYVKIVGDGIAEVNVVKKLWAENMTDEGEVRGPLYQVFTVGLIKLIYFT
jgi:hypothetical protein